MVGEWPVARFADRLASLNEPPTDPDPAELRELVRRGRTFVAADC